VLDAWWYQGKVAKLQWQLAALDLVGHVSLHIEVQLKGIVGVRLNDQALHVAVIEELKVVRGHGLTRVEGLLEVPAPGASLCRGSSRLR